MNSKTAAKWPTEVRLTMIEKSEFYSPNERVYQYGYYDGYQHASQQTEVLREENERLREYLTAIADPITHLKSRLKEGEKLDNAGAFMLSQNPNYFKSLAKEALEELDE